MDSKNWHFQILTLPFLEIFLKFVLFIQIAHLWSVIVSSYSPLPFPFSFLRYILSMFQTFLPFSVVMFCSITYIFYRKNVNICMSVPVQSLSHVRLFATSWTATHQASLSITNSWNFLKLISIKYVMPSNHLILCCPLVLLPQSFPASGSFLS